MITMATNGPAVRNGEKSLAPPSPADNERIVFESQIRECFGRVAYSHKTHEKMAERRSQTLRVIKWIQIILSALTSGGAIAAIIDEVHPAFPIATAILAVATLIVNSYVKDIDPGADAQRHREAASDIWNIREAYLSLLTDTRDETILIDLLRERRDGLQARLHKIYRSSPHTDGKAYGEAQNALKNSEDLTFSDEEIDAFLPRPLRRTVIPKEE